MGSRGMRVFQGMVNLAVSGWVGQQAGEQVVGVTWCFEKEADRGAGLNSAVAKGWSMQLLD